MVYAINYLAYARDYAILCEESRVEGRVFTLALQMAAGITDKIWITLPILSVTGMKRENIAECKN